MMSSVEYLTYLEHVLYICVYLIKLLVSVAAPPLPSPTNFKFKKCSFYNQFFRLVQVQAPFQHFITRDLLILTTSISCLPLCYVRGDHPRVTPSFGIVTPYYDIMLKGSIHWSQIFISCFDSLLIQLSLIKSPFSSDESPIVMEPVRISHFGSSHHLTGCSVFVLVLFCYLYQLETSS